MLKAMISHNEQTAIVELPMDRLFSETEILRQGGWYAQTVDPAPVHREPP